MSFKKVFIGVAALGIVVSMLLLMVAPALAAPSFTTDVTQVPTADVKVKASSDWQVVFKWQAQTDNHTADFLKLVQFTINWKSGNKDSGEISQIAVYRSNDAELVPSGDTQVSVKVGGISFDVLTIFPWDTLGDTNGFPASGTDYWWYVAFKTDATCWNDNGGSADDTISISVASGAIQFRDVDQGTDISSAASISTTEAINFIADTTDPTVANVTSTKPNGYYTVDETIDINVIFDEVVDVTGTPQLLLETGTTDRQAGYVNGTGSANLNFSYTVQPGDTSDDLEYAGSNSLTLNGGTITDLAGNSAILDLPEPGDEGSLSNNKNLVIDTAPPMVSTTALISPNGGEIWAGGSTHDITWNTDQITDDHLGETPITLKYFDGAAWQDIAAGLANDGSYAWTVPSLEIGNARVGVEATDLAGNSVGDTSDDDFAIDSTAPVISNTSPKTGSYIMSGFSVNYTLSEDVASGTIKFISGGTQTYALSGAELGKGEHTVTEVTLNGQGVSLADGTTYSIAFDATDLVGHEAATETNYNIYYNTTPPAVANVTSTKPDGYYTVDETIDIIVIFNEPVDVTGTPQLLLETGTTDRQAGYVNGTGSANLTFSYTVQPGDTSSDLEYVGSNSLTLNGGTIKDLSGNDAHLALPEIYEEGSLSYNKDLVIDTEEPTVDNEECYVSTYFISDDDVGPGNFTVTITYYEDMDTEVDPTIAFTPGVASTLSFVTGLWSDNDRYVATYDVADDNVYEEFVDITVTGAQDLAGNTQQEYFWDDAFGIDTENPTVEVYTYDDYWDPAYLINDDFCDDNEYFYVVVVFSEDMDTDDDPTISFSPDVSSTLTEYNDYWDEPDVFVVEYDVADGNVDWVSVNITVSDAWDGAGNPLAEYVEEDAFEIDTSNPYVESATAAPNPAKNGEVTITVVFSEDMDATVAPTVEITGLDDSYTVSGDYTAGHTWTGVFELADHNETDTAFISVTGGEDLAGNVMVDEPSAGSFDVDTVEPTVDPPVTPSLAIISDDDVGLGKFTVTITYYEDMDTEVDPTIAFTPGVASTLSVNATASYWDTYTTYIAVYDVADDNVDEDSVAITVSGAQDLAGNTQVEYTEENAFAIDTLNPTVDSVTPSLTVISDDDVGPGNFTVTVVYTEYMDGVVEPTIAFTPGVASTLSVNATASYWDTYTTYIAVYDVADAGVDVDSVAITVSGAQDEAGNTQVEYTGEDAFAIDTENPTVDSVTPSLTVISDDDVGPGKFMVTVVYSENMTTAKADPTIAFDPVVASTLTSISRSGWSDEYTYYVIYDVADAGVDVDNVAITVSGAQDEAGNTQVEYTEENAFAIDTENPSLNIWELNMDTGHLIMTFDEPVDAGALDATGITLQNAATATIATRTLTGGATTSDNGTEIDVTLLTADFTAIKIDRNLAFSQATSWLTITTAVINDLAGNSVIEILDESGMNVVIYIPDTTPPEVSTQYPANDAAEVAVSVNPYVTFSEVMDDATVTSATVLLKEYESGIAVSAVVSLMDGYTKAFIQPDTGLSENGRYYIEVTSGARDMAGNAIAAYNTKENQDFYTTTVDTTPPEVSSQYPVDGTTGVPVTVEPRIVFSEPMQPSTINSINIKLKKYVGDTEVTATVTLGEGDTTATITPASPLAYDTQYYLYVGPGVKDAASNSIAAAYDTKDDQEFTTVVDATDVTPPEAPVITTSDATVNSDFYTISGTVTADASSTQVVKVLSGATVYGTVIVPKSGTTWSTVVELPQDVATTFKATSTDEAGNVSADSNTVTITESATAGADLTPPEAPVITTTDATVDADSYTISGTVTADASSTQVVKVLSGATVYGTVIVPKSGTTWSAVVELPQDAVTTFKATSTDEAGNVSADSNTVTITETAAPVIYGVLADNIGTNTADISWTTDVDSTGNEVEYGTTSALGSTQPTTTGEGTSHSASLSGLSANTVYYYRVKSTAGGTTTYSDIITFATATPGVVVTNISATKTYATADGTYENGWAWVFSVTVPTSESTLKMKFTDWVSGGNIIPIADNMRFYSAQAEIAVDEAHAIYITAAGVYSEAITLIGDLDASKGGFQIEITVEARVPAGSVGGSYTTSYGILSELP